MACVKRKYGNIHPKGKSFRRENADPRKKLSRCLSYKKDSQLVTNKALDFAEVFIRSKIAAKFFLRNFSMLLTQKPQNRKPKHKKEKSLHCWKNVSC